MTDQVLFDNFNDALIAAHRQSRMVECGYAYNTFIKDVYPHRRLPTT